jgi:hypothetical protein
MKFYKNLILTHVHELSSYFISITHGILTICSYFKFSINSINFFKKSENNKKILHFLKFSNYIWFLAYKLI